jgi:spore germination protein YaaH
MLAALILAPAGLPVSERAAHGETLPEDVRYVPIERLVSEGRVNRTPYFAAIRVHHGKNSPPDVWAPSELLADMKCPVKLSPEGDRFTARINDPAVALEIPSLKTLLPGQASAVDIDFQVVSDDERSYFNITGMERVTGILGTLTDARRVIVPPASGDILVVGAESLMPDKAKPKIPEFTRPDLTPPFSLVWDHVIGLNPDLSADEPLPTVKIISPTWFALADEGGTISNKAGWPYTADAHAKGYGVWALVSNGFNRNRTKKFLGSASAQNQFIARMLVYAKLYGVDGINIDFENVDNDDAARLSSFVKKFADAAHDIGLVVSIDLPVPTEWSKAYERRILGNAVDYVAVMTYDEHWGSSPRSGSTASIPWTSAGVQRSLTDIPAKKLLMGVPFYTREWAETTAKNGKVSVRAKTMSMTSVDLRIAETRGALQWLGDKGQNYLQYVSDDKTYKIWVEDERSIAARMSLVKKFGIAGAAFWRKGFEKSETWTVIEQSLRGAIQTGYQ